MKKLIIIGAGGHGRVVSETAKLNGYEVIGFLDDADNKTTVGKVADFIKYIGEADFTVAIGNNAVRMKIQSELIKSGANVVSLIHPNATVSESAAIGKGTVVMAGAVINAGVLIGDGVIINTCASVDHDCRIGDFSHISVGARICGTVGIGDCTWVGAGATVINNIIICGGTTVGAGAVVVKDIDEIGTYVGVPAKARLFV